MATLTVQTSPTDSTGLVVTRNDGASGGDQFTNDGQTFLLLDNTSGGDIEVTINSQTACDQGGDHDLVVDVVAGVERMVGPFETRRFNDGSDFIQLTYETNPPTGLKVSPIKVVRK